MEVVIEIQSLCVTIITFRANCCVFTEVLLRLLCTVENIAAYSKCEVGCRHTHIPDCGGFSGAETDLNGRTKIWGIFGISVHV